MRHHAATWATSPTSTERIRMEADRDGVHQVIERRGSPGWIRDLAEPPPIRDERELVDKLYQGANHHAYMMALLKAWSIVRKARGEPEVKG